MKPYLIPVIFLSLFISAAFNAFAQMPVLISASVHSNSPSHHDSFSYIHSNNRQTNIEPSTHFEKMMYDTLYAWNGLKKPTYKYTRLYDQSDSLIEMRTDKYDESTKTWLLDYKCTYSYKPGHLIDYVLTENPATGQWMNLYYYDGAQNLLSIEEYTWASTSNQWVATYANDYYGYTNGKLTTTKQMYDGIIHNEIWHKYDNNGLLITDSITYLHTNSTLIRYTYYANNLAKSKEMLLWDIQTSLWVPVEKERYAFAANNSRTDVVYLHWNEQQNKYDTSSRDTFYYNNYGQLLKTQSQAYKNGTWNNDGPVYTRHYAHPTNIPGINPKESSILFYPIPATTHTNLEMIFDKPTDFSVIIFDMQGRMVKQFADKAEGHYIKNINVQEMPAGQYMLQVKTNNETISKNFTVIR